MDWLYVLMPISGVNIFWPGLIILGLGVGIIGGFFGMGGAWMVTPGLNILGFPMAFAIGTDVAHMAGKSLISTMRHGKFGNVDYKLGLTMLAGTIIGVELGAGLSVPLGADSGTLFIDGSLEAYTSYTNVNATVGWRINF